MNMSGKQPKDGIDNSGEVLNQNTGEEREKKVQERKRYLKFAVSSLFGLSVGLFARNFLCALLIMLLYSANILLSD